MWLALRVKRYFSITCSEPQNCNDHQPGTERDRERSRNQVYFWFLLESEVCYQHCLGVSERERQMRPRFTKKERNRYKGGCMSPKLYIWPPVNWKALHWPLSCLSPVMIQVFPFIPCMTSGHAQGHVHVQLSLQWGIQGVFPSPVGVSKGHIQINCLYINTTLQQHFFSYTECLYVFPVL